MLGTNEGVNDVRFMVVIAGCDCNTPNPRRQRLHFILDMSTTDFAEKLVSSIIIDLDGTLLNIDGVVIEILNRLLVKYGKQWDGREAPKIAGKTPLEAAAAVVQDYELPCTADEFLKQTNPLFSKNFTNMKRRPGADRLINHLHKHGVPMALASNSPRSDMEKKLSNKQGWTESFSVILAGDDVGTPKPSPELFLEAAKQLNVDPSSCLVIEDSVPGVTAGKAAGMEVIAVPSLPKHMNLYTFADEVINSLYDLQPEKWGLPPFQDWIEDTLPIEPWQIGGLLLKASVPASNLLGVPPANLSTKDYSDLLSEQPCGVYCGWAALPKRGIYKTVMSIGWNPLNDDADKTIEPRLLHEFKEDLYGEELQLMVVAYIRPQAKFPSIESLTAKNEADIRIAEKALEAPIYSKHKDNPHLTTIVLNES